MALAPQAPAKPTWQPPWWVEPAIYAGTALAGAYVSNRNAKGQAAKQAELQREFAQYGIRWRVADAKAAGLHPLYALGANVPTYQPVQYQDSVGPALAAMGQDVGRSVAATRGERQLQRLAALEALSRVDKNSAEAAYWRSLIGRGAQEERYRGALPDSTIPDYNPPAEVMLGEFGSTAGTADLTSPKVTATRPGEPAIVAGPAAPMLREYVLPGGFKMLLPAAQDIGEAMEPLGNYHFLWGIYKENERHYGRQWARDFKKRYAPNWWNSTVDALEGFQNEYLVKDWVPRRGQPKKGAVKDWLRREHGM